LRDFSAFPALFRAWHILLIEGLFGSCAHCPPKRLLRERGVFAGKVQWREGMPEEGKEFDAPFLFVPGGCFCAY
jgi:hypothetical protein